MKPIIPGGTYNARMLELMNEICSHCKQDAMIPVLLVACKLGMLAREPYMKRIEELEHIEIRTRNLA